ncbi:MAG: FixH family protein [Nitrospiraceae bacterium]|nr:FixH family protein [Nitrospiraceae bacterium]
MKKKIFYIPVFIALAFFSAGIAWAGGMSLVRKSADLTVQVVMDKNPSVGKNAVRVALKDASGAAVTDALMRVYYSMPAMGGMPAMNYYANAVPRGKEYVAVMDIPMAGSWGVAVKIKRGGRLLPPVKFSADAQ